MGQDGEAAFRVGGLHDRPGQREIEHNLINIDGVKEVHVSLADGIVRISFDPRVIRPEYLERTLDSLGYSPYVR